MTPGPSLFEREVIWDGGRKNVNQSRSAEALGMESVRGDINGVS